MAKVLEKYKGEDAIVLGIPRGGVPVGFEVAKELGAPLEVIVPRKIPIPWSPEAGFGAITEDGTVVLNEPLVASLRLGEDEIQKLGSSVLEEVKRRVRKYRGDRSFPRIGGRVVIILDDGLATGYTMIAAIEMVKKLEPRKIVVAVPCSPKDTLNKVGPMVDELICLEVQEYGSFAVASYYREFPDMTDEEVLSYLG